jgi:hypothetical protein
MNQILIAAATRLLTPLVRIFLRQGITWKSFGEITKKVYVDVATKDFTLSYKKLSASRISMITGIQRKEIQKIRERTTDHDVELINKHNRSTKIINSWMNDPIFTDDKGEAAVLSIEEGETSFSDLVKKFGADLTYRSVLDELVRIGAVEVDPEKECVKLLTKGFIPEAGSEEQIVIMGTDVRDILQTIDHNMTHSNNESFLQLKASYDNIPENLIPRLQKLSKEKGFSFLQEMDKWLSEYDQGEQEPEKGKKRKRVGLGLYYFEGDFEDDNK